MNIFFIGEDQWWIGIDEESVREAYIKEAQSKNRNEIDIECDLDDLILLDYNQLETNIFTDYDNEFGFGIDAEYSFVELLDMASRAPGDIPRIIANTD